MQIPLPTFLKYLELFLEGGGRLGAGLVIALVLLVSANVLLRYLFRIGSVWSQELEWHLLVPIALLGCCYTLAKGEHVRVDVLYERFPPKLKALVDLSAALVLLAVASLLIHFALPYVAQSYRTLEGSPDPGGLPARYLLKGLLPVGFALLWLQALALALRQGIALVEPPSPP
ncbi:MAG: TRAP transporter small permease subunit, partial [Candidatus Competibacterales bacterium]